MIKEVLSKGCVKKYAKMGFIESKKIEEIFEKVKPSADIRAMNTIQWINTIDEIFSS